MQSQPRLQTDLIPYRPEAIKKGISNLSEGHCPVDDLKLHHVDGYPFCENCQIFYILFPIELLGSEHKEAWLNEMDTSVTIYQSNTVQDIINIAKAIQAFYG